jgi:hypothetical protein
MMAQVHVQQQQWPHVMGTDSTGALQGPPAAALAAWATRLQEGDRHMGAQQALTDTPAGEVEAAIGCGHFCMFRSLI